MRVIKEHTFFEELFREEITIVDLGACMGEFTSALNKEYNIKKAILVEASPINFNKLPNQENYILYNNVISSTDDELVKFYVDVNSPYNGSQLFNYFNGQEYFIPSITIDRIIENEQLTHIDLLKIDIEGAEYDILPNISDASFSIIQQITIEFHDFIAKDLKERTKELVEWICSKGYKMLTTPSSYMNGTDYYDVIFFKNL